MAKERVPRYVNIATARMNFIKMIGSPDTDESTAIEDLTSAQVAGLQGGTILTGTPNDWAIPIDPNIDALSSNSNPAQSSSNAEPTSAKQGLATLSPRPTPEQSEQTVLISSSESSLKPPPREHELGGPANDEESNSEFADTAPTDSAQTSETNTSLSNPEDPLSLAQSLEANFTAFLNQRRKLEACVQAEKSSAKKIDETIAELKQARDELSKKQSRSTHELRCKVSELEAQLEAAKVELETARMAEKESDVRLTELGDRIRGEKRSKAEAAEKIKQWEATLAKTAFQSM
jgi:hypothetical protein